MQDHAARRTMMVDTQVRPSDVTKLPIIQAMLSVPRENFVPAGLVETAYLGDHLPLGSGRFLMDPRILAKMLDVLNVTPSELVLHVGCGTGYASALLMKMAQAVVALEEDERLFADAEAALPAVGAETVVLQQGPLVDGVAAHAPYDAMLIEGGIDSFPDTLAAQLREGGRVVALFMLGALGIVRLGVRSQGKIAWRDEFNATAPVLPGFHVQPAFIL